MNRTYRRQKIAIDNLAGKIASYLQTADLSRTRAHLNQRYHKLGDLEGEARKSGILIAEVIAKAHRRAKA